MGGSRRAFVAGGFLPSFLQRSLAVVPSLGHDSLPLTLVARLSLASASAGILRGVFSGCLRVAIPAGSALGRCPGVLQLVIRATASLSLREGPSSPVSTLLLGPCCIPRFAGGFTVALGATSSSGDTVAGVLGRAARPLGGVAEFSNLGCSGAGGVAVASSQADRLFLVRCHVPAWPT